MDELLKKRVVGRCFCCLASNHLVADCCDHVRCFNCLKFGHCARHCRSPPPRSHTASTSTPTSRRPLHPSTSHLKQPPTEPDTLTPSQDIAATTMPVCTDMATHRPTLTERIPSGSPVQRVERVKACVSFTAEMVATESDYHFRGLIAITI
jgi:hypothetical protein